MPNKNVVQKFNEVKQKYDLRLQELEDKKGELSEKIEQKNQDYRELVEQQALEGKEPELLQKVKTELEKLQSELADTEEMLQAVKEGRNRELSEYLPKIKNYKEKVRKEARDEYMEAAKDVQKAKAEYLKAIKNLWEINQKTVKANDEYDSAKKAAGDGSETRVGTLPWLPLNLLRNELSYEPFGIHYEEIKAAHDDGKLPQWVIDYLEKGTLPDPKFRGF